MAAGQRSTKEPAIGLPAQVLVSMSMPQFPNQMLCWSGLLTQRILSVRPMTVHFVLINLCIQNSLQWDQTKLKGMYIETSIEYRYIQTNLIYDYIYDDLEPNATTQDSIPHGAHRVFGGGIHPGAAKKF